MKLVKIRAFAQGYYSGQIYRESYFITKESYDRIKDEALSLYIGELDGKHSEVEASISYKEYTEEELLNLDLGNPNNDDLLYWELKDIFGAYGMNLDNELETVELYLATLDTYTTLQVKLRKSQKEKVLKFIEEINKG